MTKRRRRVPRYVAEEGAAELARQVDAAAQKAAQGIAADLSQQAPHNSWSTRLHYVDIEFKCVDCGRAEVWTATQQKWWYEVAKGPIFTTAIRCRACRKLLRARHAGTPRRSRRK